MGVGQYIVAALGVAIRHGPKWYLSLMVAVVINFWFFADYPRVRDRYNEVFSGTALPELPDSLSFWWFPTVILFMCGVWLALSLFHAETKRQIRAPRLMFEEPFVVRTDLEVEIAQIDLLKSGQFQLYEVIRKAPALAKTKVPIAIAKTKVRNCPTNMENGINVDRAHIKAEFREFETGRLILTVQHPRWTDNPKPRPDEMERPKFTSELNFRTLYANDAPHEIDFAMKRIDEPHLYAFRGQSQSAPFWQEPELKLTGTVFQVRLFIQGAGLASPVEHRVILRNPGTGESLKVESEEAAQCRDWIGAG